ncbi:hypothetical protein ACJMK2_034600 [Sinanodonta woodiana]|uniref:Uncharacterized protein n=1 Tax=Sinanodonta woodiana TaxID=1069815 RepID=A0ABD3WTV9_SINWO
MSSSTKFQGTETNENLKNDHKDVVPKVVSMTENNSNGAWQMTSSMPEKSNKVTKEKPLLPGPERGLNVVLMNVSGDICQTLFFFKNLDAKEYMEKVPELYIGNDEDSILYNNNVSTIVEEPVKELQRILETFQTSTSNWVNTMCVPVIEFICISWHGKHAGMNDDKKVTEFIYLIIF